MRASNVLLLLVILALSLSLPACGSDDGGSSLSGADLGISEGISADAVSDGEDKDDTGSTDDVQGESLAESSEQIGQDATDEVSTETAGEVTDPAPYATAFMEKWCDSYCELHEECHGPAEGCFQEGCISAIVSDPEWMKNLVCWGISETCDDEAHCMDAPLPETERCDALCLDADACGLLPSDMLGEDATECLVLCTAFAHLSIGTEMEPAFTCIEDAAEDCNALAMVGCVEGGDGNICGRTCESLEACGNIPGLFANQETCFDTCQSYDIGPAIALMACATFGQDEEGGDEPAPCPDQSHCFPPPQVIPDGAEDFCGALLELCDGAEGFELPADTETCGWLMAGFGSQFGSVEFSDSAACVEALPDCEDPNAAFSCLTPDYAPCAGYCEKLDGCMSVPPPEDWPGVEICTAHCNSMALQDPDSLDLAIACVMDADGCDVQHCFPKSPCELLCDTFDTCGEIPGVYPNYDSCRDTCEVWTDLQRSAVEACAGHDDDDGPSCGGMSACVPPPATAADGALALCQELSALCGAETVWPDPEACAWFLTGVDMKLPNVDFNAGATCVAEADSCGDPEQLIVGCLFGSYAGCDDYCDVLEFCWETDPPEDWDGIDQCKIDCNVMYSQWPEPASALMECVAASDCQTLDLCNP